MNGLKLIKKPMPKMKNWTWKDENLIKRYYHEVEKEAMRRMILDEGIRLDGRTTSEIRPIWGEVDYLPGAHGSAIFTRGETQALNFNYTWYKNG